MMQIIMSHGNHAIGQSRRSRGNNVGVRKADAIKLFGDVTGLATANEITPQAVSQWPDLLPLHLADRVRGAALRLKKRLPRHMRKDARSAQQAMTEI